MVSGKFEIYGKIQQKPLRKVWQARLLDCLGYISVYVGYTSAPQFSLEKVNYHNEAPLTAV